MYIYIYPYLAGEFVNAFDRTPGLTLTLIHYSCTTHNLTTLHDSPTSIMPFVASFRGWPSWRGDFAAPHNDNCMSVSPVRIV